MLTLKRNFAGSYKIEGHNRGHVISIDRSCDEPKMWRCEGRYFSSLSNAKAFMFTELS